MAKNRQTPKQSGRDRRRRGRSPQIVMPFERRNYMLLILGLVIVTLGYVIMRVENEVDGFWSLYVSPIVLLAGYLEIVYAIIWRPRSKTTDQ